MDEDIVLDVLDEQDDQEYKNAVSDVLEYPCLILYGVTTEAELEYFQRKNVDDSVAYALYGDLEGQKFRMGMLELTLGSLLALRRISDYRLVLMCTCEDSIEINLNDAETLMKFIKL